MSIVGEYWESCIHDTISKMYRDVLKQKDSEVREGQILVLKALFLELLGYELKEKDVTPNADSEL